MGHGHHHGHTDGPAPPASRRVRVLLGVVVGTLAAVTAVALAVLWPRETPAVLDRPSTSSIEYVDATVVAVATVACGPVECESVRARLDAGPGAGLEVQLTNLTSGALTPVLQVDDRIVVAREISLLAPDANYSFADHQRRQPMWLLAGLFAVVVVGVARWRGVAAFVGLAFTWWVVMAFLLPAILDGKPPIAVALAAASLILIVVLYLAHGVNARTSTALVGTLVSLGITGLLGWWFVDAAHLTGVTSDEGTFLANSGVGLDLSGLLLCGIIIGSLGVLNDVTVTQAASVWEVHGADPTQPVRRLYRAGMRIGRDHIASTVYTLVLAYAGASLPLLILFIIGNRRFGEVVNGEIVAEEIIRTLVGSIGLVASVPITTYLAALIVSREPSIRTTVAREPLPRRLLAAAGVRRSASALAEDGASPAGGPGGSADRPSAGPESDRVAEADPADAPTRARRRDRRRARSEAKARSWQAPAAEREFWEG